MAALRPARVALIDDNPDDILLARLFLRRARIALPFDAYPTGEAFLAAMERAPGAAPDVALIDLNLPMLRGAQVLRRACAADWARRTAFVACTGSCDPADRAAALEAGASAFLEKPLTERSIDTLCARVPGLALQTDADGARLLMIEPGA